MRAAAGLLALGALGAALAQPVAPGLGFPPPPSLSLRDAIERALQQNVNVVVARTLLDSSRGAAQQALGAFDPVASSQAGANRALRPLRESERNALLPFGFDLRQQLTDSYELQGGVSQQFQNGLQLGVTGRHIHTADNLLSLQGEPRQNVGAIEFQLRVPALRGSGEAVSAPLRAAEREVQASRQELEFSAAQAILGTALAYWEYRGRAARLEITRTSEQRAADLLDELRKLIDADELPPAEQNLARASLNERRAARLAAEQAALEARRVLGRQLGLHGAQAMAFGPAADDFPPYDGRPVHTVERVPAQAARAIEERADVAGLRSREQAATLRAQAALATMKPQVDFVLGATQAGLAEGAAPFNVAPALSNQWFRPGLSAQVIFSYPLGNNAAEGQWAQARAQLEGARARLRELSSSIGASVETAAWGVASAAAQLEEAAAAVRIYAVSVENERLKRRLGSATLIDVLNVEDRYTNALVNAVQARQNWASALAQLAFEAGLLIAREGDQYRARLETLLDHAAR